MAWRSTHTETTRDPKQEAADKIIALIEQGAVPWRREWDSSKCVGPQAPFNPFTKHAYRGINVILLGCNPLAYLTADPRWTTFLQAKDHGCHVKKGAKASTIFFAKPLTVKDREADEDDATKQVHLLRAYSVFHASQVEGMPPYTPPTQEDAPWTRPEAVQTIMKNCGVTFRSGGDRAFYSPSGDFISLPPDVAFSSPEYFSATCIHEINHSTGHSSRMNRDMTGGFGSEKYAIEESRVEMAASMVCNTLGLPTDYVNHAAYVATWLKKLKADKNELFRCAADAQRIADWTLGYHPDFAAKSEPERPLAPPPQKPQEKPAA